MMRCSIRAGLALLLAGVFGVPLAAEERLPHATKGELVIVCLRDGREIRGAVGDWVDDIGFRVKPADSVAYLIHASDVVAIRDATTGVARDIPLRHRRRMSAGTGALIGVLATLGILLGLGAMIGPTG